MGKKIVIDSEDAVVKKVEKVSNKNEVVVDDSTKNWIIYMIGYAIVLVIVSLLFKSLYIDLSNFGIYALLAAIIIYILNRTIKPILNILTLPITIMSMGLLYPISNVIILYITDLLLGKHFQISGFIAPFIIVIFISILNIFMEGLFIKPIINKGTDKK
jgi:putative membrane protein